MQSKTFSPIEILYQMAVGEKKFFKIKKKYPTSAGSRIRDLWQMRPEL